MSDLHKKKFRRILFVNSFLYFYAWGRSYLRFVVWWFFLWKPESDILAINLGLGFANLRHSWCPQSATTLAYGLSCIIVYRCYNFLEILLLRNLESNKFRESRSEPTSLVEPSIPSVWNHCNFMCLNLIPASIKYTTQP